MIPIAQAKLLPDGININPYDIYILLPKDEIEEKSCIVNSIWSKHTYLNKIFKIKFLYRESLLNGEYDAYYNRIFENHNVFARVLMPKGTHIKIEVSFISVRKDYIKETEEDLLVFIYQLCKSDTDEIRQMLIDTEFFVKKEDEKNERLRFLHLLYDFFDEIKLYLKETLEGKERYRIRKNSYKHSNASRDSEGKPSYLNIDLDEMQNKIQEAINNQYDIWLLAESLGFSVPDKSGKSKAIIELTNENNRMRYPSIIIKNGGKRAQTSRSYKEGIFIYTCTLLNHLKDQPFNKKDFYKFLKDIWSFRDKENEVFLDQLMPNNLREQFDWYFKIFRVLNYWQPEYKFRDKLIKNKFYQWLIKLGDDVIRNERGDFRKDSIDQGVVNIKNSIKNSLSEEKLDYINEDVNLISDKIERRSSYKVKADKYNIIFPDHEIWEELAGKSHLKSYWKPKEIIPE